MSIEWSDEEGAERPAPGAIVLSCFPSPGLAATVAGHYMLRTLQLPRIGVLNAPESAPIAIVQSGSVNPPIRVHGKGGLALVLSEFPPIPTSAAAIATAILDGAERHQARLVLGLEGVVPHPVVEDEGAVETSDEMVWSVTSKEDGPLRTALDRAKARPLADGVIGGVSGGLLVQGQARTVPVAVLLVSARDTEGYPDHRAGAALIETLDRFLPDLKIDTAPLRTQAETIERLLRATMKGRHRAPEVRDRDALPIYQ